jgi:hypothetical protein
MAAEYPTKLLNHNLTNYSEIVVPSFLLLQHSIYFFFLWSILLKVRLKSLMWDYWAQVQKHRAFIKRLFSFCCCCCFEPVAQANLKLLGPTDLPALASWVAGTTAKWNFLIYLFIYLFIYLAVLGFELRLPPWATAPVFFLWWIFLR